MTEKNVSGRLSAGISEFSDLIEQDKIYVDKTRFMKKMVDHGEKYYFLSRPRRFGKTLFLTTLKNFFQGKKELFKGFYIYNGWNSWDEHPIIRISMKKVSSQNPEILKEDLMILIENIAEENNIKLSEKGSYVSKFADLIKKLSEKNSNDVVVLIDEYDAPILSNLSSKKVVHGNRGVLQEFYNVLKESEEYLRFVFITGLSKFTKVSVFSTFNNLTDISLYKDYSTICGISENELKEHYKDHIRLLADENNLTYDEALDRINYFYDGYSWDGTNNVFNLYSTLSALSKREFQSFWFTSGTPGFIAEIFKNRKITENYFQPVRIKATELDAVDPDNINESTLLFQSGYLTIKEANRDKRVYTLKIPSFEVEEAFKDNLVNLYVEEFKETYMSIREKIWEDISNGHCDNLASRLQDHINWNPSYLNMKDRMNWKIYESMFLMWMNIMGFDIVGEQVIKKGRIDGVFKDYDKNHVVICEIKYTSDKSKSLDNLIEEALSQIKEKRYWIAYSTRKITLLAIVFKDEEIDEDFIVTLVKCKIEKWN